MADVEQELDLSNVRRLLNDILLVYPQHRRSTAARQINPRCRLLHRKARVSAAVS